MNGNGSRTFDSDATQQLRNCDIVMKGGITSGVVYPPAIREIANAFRFRNIGGTSAGAIAACATAAAEYRRLTGGDRSGFERFARVPEELGEDHALLRLFSPVRATQPLFDAIVAGFTAKSTAQRCGVAARLVTGPLRRGAVAGAIPGIALGLAALAAQPNLTAAPGVASALALATCGALLGAALHGLRYANETLKTTFYGMCVGVSDAGPGVDPAIGPWLSHLIDDIAGMAPSEPLTFGHLWYGTQRRSGQAGVRPADPAINLEMVTTCLSHGRPYTFPLAGETFAFDPSEMRRYFPEYVVAWMIEHQTRCDLPAPLVGLPAAADLPIVVAARMSLAFPFLLSAVKLYDAAPGSDPAQARARDCWFTDGGLTSNFPIALFDSPLPRWPTFAINLGEFSAGRTLSTDECENVWMPLDDCDTLTPSVSITSLSGFFGSMVGAVKDWNDTTQARLPGFRDRIVTVMLSPDEGGLNLDMDATLIKRLATRGAAAGRLLVQRFDQASSGNVTGAMDWEKHRWVRYRSAAASMQKYFDVLSAKYRNPQRGDVAYKDFIDIAKSRSAIYPLSDKTAAAEPAITELVSEVASQWERTQVDFSAGAPLPHPDLVHRLRI